ncbi:MAG: stage II sporulation protein R [Oscillospiraceae bacterium]|nr:stage II sporulation protein R [Oscillospiraceae bacterium]
MKKFIGLIILLIISFYFYSNMVDARASMQKSISEKLIRFHVLANSNSDEDQNLKLQVKDKVLEFLDPYLENVQSLEEAREILTQKEEEIKEVAKQEIAKAGYDYDVNVFFDDENFPLKSYGTISLPAGEYNAFKIVIGNGEGNNWWCVMFPPLCFIDLSLGSVAISATESRMSEYLTSDEYAYVLGKDSGVSTGFIFKSKILELLHINI